MRMEDVVEQVSVGKSEGEWGVNLGEERWS